MPDRLLRPGQLAVLLGVSPKTVSRWIVEGKIKHQRTLGGAQAVGHARIPQEEADRLVELTHQRGSGTPEVEAEAGL